MMRELHAETVVLGYACRLPGAPDVAAFDALLFRGECAVSEIPPERWSASLFVHPNPLVRGKAITAAAGLLDNPFDFDHGYFGISVREARQMDPQQRLMLEVAVDAVGHAGMAQERLKGARTGVYVGASSLEHSTSHAGDPSVADGKFMPGNALSILANRIAHCLDIQGPSLVIDTACSSALFAFDAARRAIADGEIDVAIVGGVNLLLSPMPYIGFSQAGMLSPSGLCRAFDAKADGYVRAEGAVAFIIADAEWAAVGGDQIRSRIIGSGINSNGASGALSVPSAERQAELVKQVYARAGLTGDDVTFFEAHGTGTAVGDPIEASALGIALGCERRFPLPIGSVKSNIGHLEPAAGLAGLLKAQRALETGILPATLHVDEPNPAINFEALGLAPACEPVTLPKQAMPWIAGVNSFGFGGANAHVALAQATSAPAVDIVDTATPLILSAATADALKAMAARWADRLDVEDDATAARLANAAAHRSLWREHRLMIAPHDRAARSAALRDYATGQEGAWVAGTAAPGAARPVAFVYAGNGAQWAGMGVETQACDPVFREAFGTAGAAIMAAGGPDVEALLHAPDLDDLLDEALVAQPLMFALQVALTESLTQRGIRPSAVLGHSVGEVAAAWASGALTLAQAATLSVARARCQAPLRGSGTMAAVLADRTRAQALIAECALGETAVAADNSPRSTTVSGPVAEIEELVTAARTARIPTRRLPIAYPFHGPLMDTIEQALSAALRDIAPGTPDIPFYATTDATCITGPALDPAYWWRNARQMVRFAETVDLAAADGMGVFVEIGPQPTLQNYITDTLETSGRRGTYVPGLRRRGADAADPASIVARVVAAGGKADKEAIFGRACVQTASLPAYSWDRQAFRLDASPDALNVNRRPADHPLLGWSAIAGEPTWRTVVDEHAPPWLGDHRVDGRVVLAGAAMVELALAAGAATLGTTALTLQDFDLVRMLSLHTDPTELRTHFDSHSGRTVIESRPAASGGDWALHAEGTVRPLSGNAGKTLEPAPHAMAVDRETYDNLTARGLDYGPAFRRLGAPRVSGNVATASLLPSSIEWPERGWLIDPTDLDAALHLLVPLLAGQQRPDLAATKMVPIHIGRLSVHRAGSAAAQAQVRLVRVGHRSAVIDVQLADTDGAIIAVAEGLRLGVIRASGRAENLPPVWTERLHPVKLEPEAPAVLPPAWAATPAERLIDLGVASTEAPAARATALVLDAACRRVIWDAARALAPDGGVRFRARRALQPALLASFMHGLTALEADGAYDPDTDAVVATAPIPALDALADALIATEPADIARFMEVLRLKAAFADNNPPTAPAAPPDSQRVALHVTAITDMLDMWPAGQPVRVAVVGSRSSSLITTVERYRGVDLTSLHAPAELANDKGLYDVLLFDGAGAPDRATQRMLIDALCPGGLLLGTWPQEDLLQALQRIACGTDSASRPSLTTGWQTPGADHVHALHTADGSGHVAVVVRDRDAAAAGARDADGPPFAILADATGPGVTAAIALRDALAAADRTARLVDNPADIAPTECAVMLAGLYRRSKPPVATAASRLDALRALIARAPQSIYVASLGTAAMPSEDAALAHIGRVLANERPSLPVISVHCCIEQPDRVGRMLAEGLLAGGTERHLRIGPEGACAPRFTPADLGSTTSQGSGSRLVAPVAGGLEALRWVAHERAQPGTGEIQIAVEATGLNFRDVMWAMGFLPEEALEEGFSGAGLGMECAGTVVAAGEGARWAVGTRVMAFAANAFASHVTIADTAAVALPDAIGFAEAATLPVAVATAHYALVHLGQIQVGETVLIHGGAGGVGLAALQIARARGARVLATAGTAEKRDLLRLLGAAHVFDSRSLAFADGVIEATDGRGVDVVLNSLAGNAMEASMRCVAPFGRFVELGKRDFYTHGQIGLRPLRRNVAYFAVDLDAMLAAKPLMARALLDELATSLERGDIAPLPHAIHGADDVRDAFRLMQRSEHVGKVIVQAPKTRAATPPVEALARRAGAWLITGGTQGFGLAFACHLAAHGAGAVWLASRRGTVEDRDALAAIEATGTRVEIAACDVRDEAAMAALLARIAQDPLPLDGIAHAAMILDDAPFDAVDGARLAASAEVKMGGALLLDRLSETLPLRHFLLFSSVATALGNPGQTAYVAANAGLEAVATARRARGKPGLAVRWPAIADAGLLGQDETMRHRLAERGAAALPAAEAFALFEAGRQAEPDAAVLTIAPYRWSRLRRELPFLSDLLFSVMAAEGAGEDHVAVGDTLLADLDTLDDGEALKRIRQLLRGAAARILRHDETAVDSSKTLVELGFDSLMAVEFKMAIEDGFGLAIPVSAMSESSNIDGMAAALLGAARSGTTHQDDIAIENSLNQHLSKDDAAALAARLGTGAS